MVVLRQCFMQKGLERVFLFGWKTGKARVLRVSCIFTWTRACAHAHTHTHTQPHTHTHSHTHTHYQLHGFSLNMFDSNRVSSISPPTPFLFLFCFSASCRQKLAPCGGGGVPTSAVIYKWSKRQTHFPTLLHFLVGVVTLDVTISPLVAWSQKPARKKGDAPHATAITASFPSSEAIHTH